MLLFLSFLGVKEVKEVKGVKDTCLTGNDSKNRAVANTCHLKCMPQSFHPMRIGWKDGGIKKRYYIFIRCEQANINNNLPNL